MWRAIGVFLAVSGVAFGADVEWEMDIGIDGQLYPSAILCLGALQPGEKNEEETVLGDPYGMVGVLIESPRDNAKVSVELECPALFATSRFDGVLAEEGTVYSIYPVMKYHFDKLAAIRQPGPETITARVTVDGVTLPERSVRTTVHAINNCMLAYIDHDGEVVDTSYLFAAYVNENHPWIDKFLGEVLDSGAVDSFAGYQKSEAEVMEEIQAVYDGLAARGFRYSNITTTSSESDTVFGQHVRLVGESVKTAQANCVDGSVLMASILRKLGMDCFLVLVPGHMFLGVWVDQKRENFICVETTLLGSESFEDAVEAGNAQLDEHMALLDNDDPSDGGDVINIMDWRKEGIYPIKEIKAEEVE